MRSLKKLIGFATLLLVVFSISTPVFAPPDIGRVDPEDGRITRIPGSFTGPKDPLVIIDHRGENGNPTLNFRQDGENKAHIWWDQTHSNLNFSIHPNDSAWISLHEDGSVYVNGSFSANKGIKFPDGTVKNKAELIGPQGERGVQGVQGVQGVRGVRGERGERGERVAVKTVAVCHGNGGGHCANICTGTLVVKSEAPCSVRSDNGLCDWGGDGGECCVCSP